MVGALPGVGADYFREKNKSLRFPVFCNWKTLRGETRASEEGWLEGHESVLVPQKFIIQQRTFGNLMAMLDLALV